MIPTRRKSQSICLRCYQLSHDCVLLIVSLSIRRRSEATRSRETAASLFHLLSTWPPADVLSLPLSPNGGQKLVIQCHIRSVHARCCITSHERLHNVKLNPSDICSRIGTVTEDHRSLISKVIKNITASLSNLVQLSGH